MVCLPVASAGEGAGDKGEVVVVRAIASYSPGYPEMLAQLQAHGYRVRTYIPSTAILAADEIARDRQSGRSSGELVVFGYSLGADASLTLARKLGERGLTVDRQVLLEPTIPPSVPGNVRYCFNLYESRPYRDFVPALRGIGVQRESANTELVNYDLRKYRPSGSGRTTHLFILHNAHWRSVLVSQMVTPREGESSSVAARLYPSARR
jgi:hypothetical protein